MKKQRFITNRVGKTTGQQAHGRGRQRLVIQDSVTRYRTAGRLRAGRMVKNQENWERGTRKR